ncbi:hypothetical protein [Yoonia sp. R2-816]|uniref:hypothetical protein n=1 Tax=Yoonia sp. R2-816 TaxID=3342638 RepID=UPI003729EB62
MSTKAAALLLATLLGLGPAWADGHLGNPIITAPDRPLPPTCYSTETDTLSAAVLLEEIEGEAIDVSGYGNVTTAEGESWGFLVTFTGVLDGAFLTGTSTVSVDGDQFEELRQWAFADGAIVTEMGTFTASDCDGIEDEFINRSIN